MKLFKNYFTVKHWFLSALFLGSVCVPLFSQNLTDYEIMKRSEEKSSPTTSSYTATMTLVNKKGNTRVREVVFYTKEFSDSKRSVVVFRTPKDVKGVGYLMWEYKADANGKKKDNDSWLYLPAMKRVRRILGSESGDDFMGTDFTYDDLGDRGLTKDNFTLLGEETVNNAPCYKIEATSIDKNEKNPRRILWVRKDNFVVQACEFYNKQNVLQRVLTCENVYELEGIWTTGKMTMKNVITGSSTVLQMDNVQYNQEIQDSIFTVVSLERGAIK